MDNLNFTYAELLAEIGAKTLIIQRLNARIADLEEALAHKPGRRDDVGETLPEPLAIAGNGAKGKGVT